MRQLPLFALIVILSASAVFVACQENSVAAATDAPAAAPVPVTQQKEEIRPVLEQVRHRPRHALGMYATGGLSVSATQIGDTFPGRTVGIDLHIVAKRVRHLDVTVWIGPESDRTRWFAPIDRSFTTFTSSAPVPNPVDEDDAWWVEIRDDHGVERISFPLAR